MNPVDELAQLISEKKRRIFVAENPIDLTSDNQGNSVYVLELPVSALGAAGGRIGGIGERRLEKLYCFHAENGIWTKVYEIEDSEKLEKFELPYHAAGLSVILPDGSARVVSGVVDQEFIQKYNEVI